MSISSEITRLQNAKASIKTSIEAKGVTVPSSAKLDDYDTYVDQISGGSGGANSLTRLFFTNDVDIDVSESDLTGATQINSYAFYRQTKLRSMALPTSVTSINSSAFELSNVAPTPLGGLANITMPGVTSVGASAFRYCRRLTSVNLTNCTSIGTNAFDTCINLATVTSPTSSFTIGDSAFSGCSSLSSIGLTNCTTINASAFKSCTSLTSITIPNSVTSIGSSAFYDCTGITSFTFNANVTTIPGQMLYGCNSLTSFVVPSTVTSIGGTSTGQTNIRVFYNCTSLTSLTIPTSVTIIGRQCFENCTSLTTITYEGTMAEWGSITKGNNWNLNSAITTIHCSDGDITI